MPIDPKNIVPLEPRVIEIHPDAKYLVMLPESVSEEDALIISDTIGEWWGDPDIPFLVIPGYLNIKLVRVDEGEPNFKPEKALEDEL